MKLVLMSFVLVLVGVMPAVAQETTISGRDTVYTGVYSDEWESFQDLSLASRVGPPITFGGTFHHPGEGASNTFWILEQVWRAGATPVANLEVPVSAYEIAAGFYDPQLAEWAASVKQWLDLGEGRSLFIAPMAEMNGDWVPWGMDPGNYQIAFRHVRSTFLGLGMGETQVRWVFAPNSISTWPHVITDYWPGGDVVDVVGLSAYNIGGVDNWLPVSGAMGEAANMLRSVAPDKPFLITQIATSSAGGDKNQWLIDMFDYIADDPNMVGFVYFNFHKEADWKVWDDSGVAWGWLLASQDERVNYQHPLTDWFRPGPLPFSTAPPAPEVVPDPTPPVFTGDEALARATDRAWRSAARPE